MPVSISFRVPSRGPPVGCKEGKVLGSVLSDKGTEDKVDKGTGDKVDKGTGDKVDKGTGDKVDKGTGDKVE